MVHKKEKNNSLLNPKSMRTRISWPCDGVMAKVMSFSAESDITTEHDQGKNPQTLTVPFSK